METTKIIEINKLGRNVYFDSENHIKYVIMNNPKDVVDPTPQYPHLCAGYNETFSTNRFYDYLTNTWKEGSVDRYFGGILYETDYSGNIITDVVNQHITKNGHYLAKPYYAKDVMVQHRFDIDIPLVEKTVNVEEFGQFQIFDEDGKHISKVNITNKPNFDFFGIRCRWKDGTVSNYTKSDFHPLSYSGKVGTLYKHLLLYEQDNNIHFWKNNSHGTATGPYLFTGTPFLAVDICDDNAVPANGNFVTEIDYMFDTVYHEYDPILGWTVKTLKFVIGSWVQSTITGPLYDMIWSYLFPNRANLLTLGANILDAAIDGLDVFFPDE